MRFGEVFFEIIASRNLCSSPVWDVYVGSCCGLTAPCFNTLPRFPSAELALLTHRMEGSPFSLSAYFDPFFEGQILGPTLLLWNKCKSPFLCCVIAACARVGWFG